MAKQKSKASSTTRSNTGATDQATPNGQSDYFTRKQFTQQQLDLEKSRSRQQAENEQTQLERDAIRLTQLKQEIADTEHQLHQAKMQHRDLTAAYNSSLDSLARKLDSIR